MMMALFVAGCGSDGSEDELQDTEDKRTETTTEDDMEESTDEPDGD